MRDTQEGDGWDRETDGGGERESDKTRTSVGLVGEMGFVGPRVSKLNSIAMLLLLVILPGVCLSDLSSYVFRCKMLIVFIKGIQEGEYPMIKFPPSHIAANGDLTWYGRLQLRFSHTLLIASPRVCCKWKFLALSLWLRHSGVRAKFFLLRRTGVPVLTGIFGNGGMLQGNTTGIATWIFRSQLLDTSSYFENGLK